MAMSTLLRASNDELEGFRKSRLGGDESIELERLELLRDVVQHLSLMMNELDDDETWKNLAGPNQRVDRDGFDGWTKVDAELAKNMMQQSPVRPAVPRTRRGGRQGKLARRRRFDRGKTLARWCLRWSRLGGQRPFGASAEEGLCHEPGPARP